MRDLLRKLVRKVAGEHCEAWHFIELVRLAQRHGASRVLDVGCGYGEKLKLLQSLGFDVVGVDVNSDAVGQNLKSGFHCFKPDEFLGSSQMFDIVLMSHVIEHFAPSDLLEFMDAYLSHLKVSGHLLVVTPFVSPLFFYNFDHVKPYPPEALDEIFVQVRPQVKFVSRYRLELVGLRMRKRPFLYQVSLHGRTKHPRVLRLARRGAVRLHRYSCGAIGRTDGWLGLYRNKGVRDYP